MIRRLIILVLIVGCTTVPITDPVFIKTTVHVGQKSGPVNYSISVSKDPFISLDLNPHENSKYALIFQGTMN